MKSGNLNFLKPSGSLQACNGTDLPYCSTNRKVAGSIPDAVIGIFHWHNPSGRTVALGCNRNECQEYFLGSKSGRCVRLTTLPPSCADCLEIWEPQPPGILGACPGRKWDCFTFILLTPTSSINQKSIFYLPSHLLLGLPCGLFPIYFQYIFLAYLFLYALFIRIPLYFLS